MTRFPLIGRGKKGKVRCVRVRREKVWREVAFPVPFVEVARGRRTVPAL